jgi:hypothetical protein
MKPLTMGFIHLLSTQKNSFIHIFLKIQHIKAIKYFNLKYLIRYQNLLLKKLKFKKYLFLI